MPDNKQVPTYEDRSLIIDSLSQFIKRGPPSRVIINRPDPHELDSGNNPRAVFGFVAVPEGSWVFRTAEGEKEVRSGQIMVSPPGAWHVEINGTQRTKLAFAVDPRSIYTQQTWHREGVRIAHKIVWTYSPVGLNQAGYQLLLALAALESGHRPMPTAKLASLGVLLELRKHFELGKSSSEERSKSFATYRTVLSFLHQNFHQPLTREEIATQLKLHPNHISRLFREHNQEFTFKGYLTRLRMERAARLIRRKAFSLDEICFGCGYSDPVHFRKAFRKYHGIPPGQFA